MTNENSELAVVAPGSNEQTAETRAAIEIIQKAMSSKRRHRNLDRIAKSAVFMLKIRVRTGVKSSIRLEAKNFTDPAVTRELARLGSKDILIPSFKGISDAYSALSSKKKKIERKYMVCFDPYWVVSETDLPEVAKLINEARELIPTLKEQLEISYPSAVRSFRFGLLRLLSSAFPKPEDPQDRADRNRLILSMADEKQMLFPTLEGCKEGLAFEVDWVGQVPSIKEQMKLDLEIKQLATAQMEDENKRQVAMLEKQLELDSIKRRREMFAKVQEDAMKQLYKVIADGIDMVSKDLRRGNVHLNTRRRIETQIKRMDSLLVMLKECEGIEELAAAADSIQSICDRNAKGAQDLSQELQNLREWLMPKVEATADQEVLDILMDGMI